MDYTRKKFTVAVGGDAYRDGWDAVFGGGKKPEVVMCETCVNVPATRKLYGTTTKRTFDECAACADEWTGPGSDGSLVDVTP